jgi:predicted transcriptional regulator
MFDNVQHLCYTETVKRGRCSMANTERIGIRINADTKKKLEIIAEQEDRSLSNLINRILAEYLRRFEQMQDK